MLLFSGCATETKPTTPTETPSDEPESTEEPKPTEPLTETPVEGPKTPVQTNLWEADGIIAQNEYKNSREFGGRFSVYWFNDDEYIYMALKGQTSGWVSIGFERTLAIRDADMIFGLVSRGIPTVLDQ